ncbi:MAG TPA: bacterial transcriptional activator domain-containing protein [Dehalococcoidia bacterium]|nr:bacterial transcriptional activator domain-containing protein [Dehalococcoidia bacterium]
MAIWGEDTPDAWDVALNALISRLRTVLRRLSPPAPMRIEGDVGRYQLVLPAGVFVDAERARVALHQAETLARQADPDRAVGKARVALEIAARGFLAGEEAPWIEGQRRQLRDIECRAIECLAEAELTRERPHLAEDEVRRLIEVEPTRESAYRLLMRALVVRGNRGQLAGVMADCRRALRDRAGTSPSPQTEDLFRRLIQP